MKFRTEYVPEKSPFIIDPARPTALLGSCFADNLGNRMRSCLWEAENPLGTLYNPLSIAKALEISLKPDLHSFEDSLFEADGVCRSWLFDSKISAENPDDVRRAFIERSKRLTSILERAEVLFITFGTSRCYYLQDSALFSNREQRQHEEKNSEGLLVANCHKQPAALFLCRRLSVRDITECWSSMVDILKERFPSLKIIFTVSPVRHLKDGFVENSRSKAILQLAVEELCGKFENCHYFPAYEIVMDDLRDYRFYASDLLHPSDEAIEYIWEIFKSTYISPTGLARLKEGESIKKGLDHRPLPNATRNPSAASKAKEEARLSALQERLRRFKEY